MASTPALKIDSGILQYVPKGQFYEASDAQFTAVMSMWKHLFKFDRTLFSLITLLGGTGFSKGAMNHMLLANSQTGTGTDLVPSALPEEFEKNIIRYNLEKLSEERFARAIKNLMMLTGGEGFVKVNNARTRKLILEFIFSRDNKNLDSLAVNFKTKLRKLVRHALGKQTIYKIVNGDEELFQKWIGRYNRLALPVVEHLFDKQPQLRAKATGNFPLIRQYWYMKKAAAEGNIENFKKYMKGMPQRTIIGFRNSFKVPIELSEIYEKSTMSDRESLQSEAAVKRSGAKAVEINYKKHDIYDLWKSFYFKLLSGDPENMDKIAEAIDYRSSKSEKISLGECVVIIDASRSMVGSDERKLHPFLTSLSVLSILDDVKQVIYVGGKTVESPIWRNVVIPMNHTDLWKGLIRAVKTKVPNIIVLSDGYENAVKGMFKHAYDYFKNNGRVFNLIHINPVFSAEAKSGTARMLTPDVKPLPLSDYRHIETELIFNRILENKEMVKALLVNKYQKLLGGIKDVTI
jgi:hypothetical protein